MSGHFPEALLAVEWLVPGARCEKHTAERGAPLICLLKLHVAAQVERPCVLNPIGGKGLTVLCCILSTWAAASVTYPEQSWGVCIPARESVQPRTVTCKERKHASSQPQGERLSNRWGSLAPYGSRGCFQGQEDFSDLRK